MSRVTALCAVAGLALTAVAATSPAQASYHIIHWKDSGLCQVWDDSWSVKPSPAGFKNASKPVPTFLEAVSIKVDMLKKGACKL